MKKVTLTLLLFLIPSLNYAKQIICLEDDGINRSLNVKFDLNNLDGSYKLVKTTRWLSLPDRIPQESIKIIASDMKCNFIGDAGYCTNGENKPKQGLRNHSISIEFIENQKVKSLTQTETMIDSTILFGIATPLYVRNEYFDSAKCSTTE